MLFGQKNKKLVWERARYLDFKIVAVRKKLPPAKFHVCASWLAARLPDVYRSRSRTVSWRLRAGMLQLWECSDFRARVQARVCVCYGLSCLFEKERPWCNLLLEASRDCGRDKLASSLLVSLLFVTILSLMWISDIFRWKQTELQFEQLAAKNEDGHDYAGTLSLYL